VIVSLKTQSSDVDRSRTAADFATAINVIRRATASRVGFGALAAAIAFVGAGWSHAAYWFVAMAAWEIILRPGLEARIAAPVDERGAKRAFALLAALNFIGATAYCVLPVASWASGAAIGQVLAATWLCGTASHVLVYFSNNKLLLAANLVPSALVALLTPLMLAEVGLIERLLGSVVLVTILAATGVFARDRNSLLQTLSHEAQARTSAEEANEAKAQFLSIISHELRTPINSVVGYSEMLHEELAAKGEAQLRDDASKILGSGRALLGLVNRIITLARLESGDALVEPITVSLADVVRGAAEAARELAEANGNRLIVHADPMGVAALDPEMFAQCVTELCNNAAKFTRNGEIKIIAERVRVRAVEMLQVDVVDTGIGVDEALAEKIFLPFVQGDSRADRRFEGAGTGLAVVRALARLMGGEVSFSNRDGGGTIFTLRVPIAGVASNETDELTRVA
jgi:signal transduction histidine kinase